MTMSSPALNPLRRWPYESDSPVHGFLDCLKPLAVFLAFWSLLPTSLLAQPVSGDITADTVWSGAVDMVGDVRIRAGATLTVQAGTVVQVAALTDAQAGGSDANRSELILDGGVLLVQGSEAQPVLFTSAATQKAAGDWLGLAVVDGDVTLEHFVVEYAVDGLFIEDHDLRFNTAVYRHGTLRHCYGRGLRIVPHQESAASQLVVEDFQILFNEEHGVLLVGYGGLEVTLRNCIIQQNGDAPRGRSSGLYITSLPLRLENCLVKANGNHGIELYYTSLTAVGCTLENNHAWGLLAYISHAELRQNTLRFNGDVSRGGGAYLLGWNTPRTLVVNGNTFSDHPAIGLQLDDGGADFVQAEPITANVFTRNGLALWARVSLAADSLVLSGNDFLDNDRVVETGGLGAVQANGNHWGLATTTELQQSRVNLTQVVDSRDDRNQGQVWIGTWQTAPVVGGGGGTLETISYTEPDVTLQVAGEITDAQTWSGKVLLTGDVRVGVGGRLTIQPGTRIVVDFLRDSRVGGEDATRCELTVAGGQLIVQGQSGNPVVLTSAAAAGAQRPGDWRGLLVLDGDVTLENFVVEYPVEGLWIRDPDLRFNTAIYRHGTLQHASGRGLRIDPSLQTASSQLVLEHFQILFNEEHGAYLSGSGGLEVVLSNAIIQQNGDTPRGRFSGVYDTSMALRLENCLVKANGNHGVELYYSSLAAVGCTVENNYDWGVLAYVSQAELRQNTLRFNGDTGRGGGAYLLGWNTPRTLAVTGNTFSDHPSVGLQLDDGGADFVQANPVSANVFTRNGLALWARVSLAADSLAVTGNDFLQNDRVLETGGLGAVLANGNHWGLATTTELQQNRVNLTQIVDSRDDASKGQVWIGTWQTTPVVGGGGGTLETITYTVPGVTMQAAGDIADAQTWSGKVLLTGDVRVLGGGRLTIQPGTQVVVDFLRDSRVGGEDATRSELVVAGGQLEVLGESGNPVVFTSAAATGAQRPGDWRGMLVLNGDVTLAHFVTEYAVEGLWIRDPDVRFNTAVYQHGTLRHGSGRGVRIDPTQQTAASQLVLEDFEIMFNEEQGVYLSGSGGLELVLRGGFIQQNGDTPRGRFSGVYGSSLALRLENVLVKANGYHGVELYYSGLAMVGCTVENNAEWGVLAYISQAELRQNTFRFNGGLGVGGGAYLLGWNTPRTLVITGNTFSDHPAIGLQLDDGGTPFVQADPINANVFTRNGQALWLRLTAAATPFSLSGNDFLSNDQILRNAGAGATLANGNHWGEPTTTELTQGVQNLSRILDAQDDPSSGAVTIQQWAPTPLLQGGEQPKLTSALLYCVFIEGTVGRDYQIQAASSPEGPWTPVATVRLTTSPQIWVDTESDRTEKRFYQAILLP